MTLSLQAVYLGYVHNYFGGVTEADGNELATPSVNGSTLTLVKEFITHRAKHPFPDMLDSKGKPIVKIEAPLDNKGDLSQTLKDVDGKPNWYREFMTRCTSKGAKSLFDLLRAGSFLQSDDLMNLTAAAIATKYASFSEKKQLALNPLPSDAEEERIKKKEAWAEEEPDLIQLLIKNEVLPAEGPGAAAPTAVAEGKA